MFSIPPPSKIVESSNEDARYQQPQPTLPTSSSSVPVMTSPPNRSTSTSDSSSSSSSSSSSTNDYYDEEPLMVSPSSSSPSNAVSSATTSATSRKLSQLSIVGGEEEHHQSDYDDNEEERLLASRPPSFSRCVSAPVHPLQHQQNNNSNNSSIIIGSQPIYKKRKTSLTSPSPASLAPSSETAKATTAPKNEKLLRLFDGVVLWEPSSSRWRKARDTLQNKVVLLYFSAHWCGPCKRFTPKLIEFYKKMKSRQDIEDFELIYCSMGDVRNNKENDMYVSNMPWLCIPKNYSTVVDKLAQEYKAHGIPHLVLLDEYGKVIIDDCIDEISMNPDGIGFPWRPKTISELLPKNLLRNTQVCGIKTIPTTSLDNKYMMLFFSGGPHCNESDCHTFTPLLCNVYKKLKEANNAVDDFEIVYVSNDDTKEQFNNHYNHVMMSQGICAVPFGEIESKVFLNKQFNIKKLPTLIMLSPLDKTTGDRSIINNNVTDLMIQSFNKENKDKTTIDQYTYNSIVNAYPFYDNSSSNNDTADERLLQQYCGDLCAEPSPFNINNNEDDNNGKCFIIFHENGDDEEQDHIIQTIKLACKAYYNNNNNQQDEDERIRFYWSLQFQEENEEEEANDTPSLSYKIRSAVDGMSTSICNMEDEPTMVLIDLSARTYYKQSIGDIDDITIDTILDFSKSPHTIATGKQLQTNK